MQRKVFLLALVLSLLVVFSSTAGVMANKPPGLPHDGGCVAHCARAVVHELVAGGDEMNDDDWAPVDLDGDGKPESCLREFDPESEDPMFDRMCHHIGAGACPEYFDDPDYPEGRCVLQGDGWGFWCRVMQGPDTHGRPH